MVLALDGSLRSGETVVKLRPKVHDIEVAKIGMIDPPSRRLLVGEHSPAK